MKIKLITFPIYYGFILFLSNVFKSVYYYKGYFDAFSLQVEEVDEHFYVQLEVAAFYATVAVIFLIGVIFRSPKFLLSYYLILLLVWTQRYALYFLGKADLMETKFIGIVGIPIFYIIPQMLAIFFLVKRLLQLRKEKKHLERAHGSSEKESSAT